MTKKEELRELFDKADKIRPMAEEDGEVYVTFEEAAVLNSVNAMEGKGTGMQVRDKNGNIVSTGKTVHAMNPDKFFDNRYKTKGKKMYVVSGHEPVGYYCIKEQDTGRCRTKSIPCYVIARNEATNKLEIEKLITVSESEFLSDYTHRLSNKAFAQLLPLITSYGTDLTVDDMPI